MKIEHKGCGGKVVSNEVDKGSFTLIKGYKCVQCGAELQENLTELFCHGLVVVTAESRLDEVAIEGMQNMKKCYDEPTVSRRIKYPKKTRAYRKRRNIE